jgi:hypothetical protein
MSLISVYCYYPEHLLFHFQRCEPENILQGKRTPVKQKDYADLNMGPLLSR